MTVELLAHHRSEEEFQKWLLLVLQNEREKLRVASGKVTPDTNQEFGDATARTSADRAQSCLSGTEPARQELTGLSNPRTEEGTECDVQISIRKDAQK